jgi:2'-5' RNA ligase
MTAGALAEAAARLDDPWLADRLVLFESHTGGGPARYEPLHEVALRG